ncbi:MAG: CBM20 domain-containing protein, partial [Bacteroidota bacterium]
MRTTLTTVFCLALVYFGTAQQTVTFLLEEAPPAGFTTVGIRGSVPPLSWEKTTALRATNGQFTTTITFPAADDPLEFKFVYHATAGAEPTWEGTDNRLLTFPPASDTYVAKWEVLPVIDPATVPPLTVAQLQADYPLIEKAIRDLHPGAYRYLSEEELEAALARLKESFSTPLTVGEAYLALNKLTAALRCDHTGSPLYNQSAVVNSILHQQADKLPFTFSWRDERMIVRYDATRDKLLPVGSEVLSLDGRPVAEVLRDLRPYVAADGPALAPVDAKLSLRGYPFGYDAFDALYPLVFSLPEEGLTITYRINPAGPVRKATVTPTTREARTQVLGERHPDFPQRADDQYRLDVREDGVAILTIGNFLGQGYGALELDYREFFAEVFAKIKEVG